MGKIAFEFSGQGAQYPGMGRALYERSEAARRVFDAADALRPDTSRQCFEGTAEELCETKNTQPCMFTVELAAAAALQEAGITADMAAGFSLGELAALTFAGAMDFETGFQLVCRRACHMQRAAEQRETAMAAVLKLDNDTVRALCARFSEVYPVNFNCPGQVTVSGLADQIAALSAAVKEAGGRAVPLKVRGGFHSPFMNSAAEAFSADLAQAQLQAPQLPVYANLTAQPYTQDVRGLLTKQICSPVLWEDSVRSMIAAGADTFIELGPGRTLCGLIAKTDKAVRTYAAEQAADLEKTISEVHSC